MHSASHQLVTSLLEDDYDDAYDDDDNFAQSPEFQEAIAARRLQRLKEGPPGISSRRAYRDALDYLYAQRRLRMLHLRQKATGNYLNNECGYDLTSSLGKDFMRSLDYLVNAGLASVDSSYPNIYEPKDWTDDMVGYVCDPGFKEDV